jgi:hypothetical protein
MSEGAELLNAVQQMKKGKTGRVYSEEQLLAISARKSANLTQRQFAELLNVSIDAMIRTGPLHFSHFSMSMENTRLSCCAQVIE